MKPSTQMGTAKNSDSASENNYAEIPSRNLAQRQTMTATGISDQHLKAQKVTTADDSSNVKIQGQS